MSLSALTNEQINELNTGEPSRARAKLGTRLSDLETWRTGQSTWFATDARISLATNPVHGNTLTIGSDVYQFRVVATSPNVTNDAYIGVVVGANAAATQANLLAAINATYIDNEHPSLFLTDGETPAKANGSESVTGSVTSNVLTVVLTERPGSGVKTYALKGYETAATLQGSPAWSHHDVAQIGGAPAERESCQLQFEADADAVATGAVTNLYFPFEVAGFVVSIRDSDGKTKTSGDDTFTVSGSTITLTIDGSSATMAAGDFVSIIAWS